MRLAPTLRLVLLLCTALPSLARAQDDRIVRFDAPFEPQTDITFRVKSERGHVFEAPIVPGGEQRERWTLDATLHLRLLDVNGEGASFALTLRDVAIEHSSSLAGNARFPGGARERDRFFTTVFSRIVDREHLVRVDQERAIIELLAPNNALADFDAEQRSVYEHVLGRDRLSELVQALIRPAGSPAQIETGSAWEHVDRQRTALGAVTLTSTHTLSAQRDGRAEIDVEGTIAIDTSGLGRRLLVEQDDYEGAIVWDTRAGVADSASSSMTVRYTIDEGAPMHATITSQLSVERLHDDQPSESPVSLDDLLARACERFNQPGMVAAVVSSDRVLAIGAAGTRMLGVDHPVTIHDAFHLGSCTKAITALLLAQELARHDALTLDSTLVSCFPGLADAMHPGYRDVTLREVLAHRAGLPAYTRGNAPEQALLRDLPEDPRAARAMFAQRLLTVGDDSPAAPGPHTYSNAGYALAAAVTERLADRPWEVLLRERLFAPLAMDHAGLGWPARQEDPTAQPHGHYAGAQRPQPMRLTDPYELQSAMDPAGDVHASITGWARYAQDRLRALRGGDSPILDTDATRDLMTPPVGADYAGGWGLGAGALGSLLAHDGSAGTFYSSIWILPDYDRAVLVVTNAGSGQEACAAVRERLIERYVRPD